MGPQRYFGPTELNENNHATFLFPDCFSHCGAPSPKGEPWVAVYIPLPAEIRRTVTVSDIFGVAKVKIRDENMKPICQNKGR